MVGPSSRRYHGSVNHRFRVYEFGSRRLYIRLESWIGRGALPFKHARCNQCQRRVAELRHRLLLFEEVSNDAQAIRVIANVFARAAARDHQRPEVGGLVSSEGQACFPEYPGFSWS